MSLSDISNAHATTHITGSATMMRAKIISAVSFVIFPYASIRQGGRIIAQGSGQPSILIIGGDLPEPSQPFGVNWRTVGSDLINCQW